MGFVETSAAGSSGVGYGGLRRQRPARNGTWTEPALRVLRERYLAGQGGEVVETPEDMCWRVAAHIAEAERAWGADADQIQSLAAQFYEILTARQFLPNSPTLMNAGTNNGLQYSACYVLPVGDSMEEIFDALKGAAIIHKSGGGTGFSFSRLRPRDAPVASTGGKSSGPVSFLRVFNSATEAVKQGGVRRGANMGVLRVDHPDILAFIDCKLDGGIDNFNISVAVTDDFMGALSRDEEYQLFAPPHGKGAGRLSARSVWQRIVRAAWETGDPGVVFIDRINAGRANPTFELGPIEATNPCGEQPLLPNEACNLGSLNLLAFAARDAAGAWTIDFGALERVTRLAVRFLDDVIEVNPYPLPEIDRTVKANRRIGLGVMGWADLLFRLGVPYDSDAALELCARIMSFIDKAGRDASARLSNVRGPFPNWARSIFRNGPKVRNSTVTTIAPTGTISIIAGCSSGIEPVFALAFTHQVGGRILDFVNPVFEQVAHERGFHSAALMEQVARSGSVQGAAAVPEDVRSIFKTAHEIPYEWHIRHQATFQRFTDNGVSKTINLPQEATVDHVDRAYRLAWDLGCLGITVFRDGCKEGVLRVGAAPPAPAAEAFAAPPSPPLLEPRPQTVHGATHRIATPLGTAYVVVNQDAQGEPFEVFISVGKAGSDTMAVAEAIGRLISFSLRMPSPVPRRDRLQEVIAQLSGIGGSRSMGLGPRRVRSLPDAIAQALAEHAGSRAPGSWGDICPDCGGAKLVYEEGCQKCYGCGFSEC
jgi:ribonucleoside-diphosphate reductase alpha chain